MKSKLQERIELPEIQELESDIRTFLKNVNRLKNVEQFFDLQEYWLRWKGDYFSRFLKRSIGKDSKVVKGANIEQTQYYPVLTKLEEYISDLFSIDQKNIEKFEKKSGWIELRIGNYLPPMEWFNELDKNYNKIVQGIKGVTKGGTPWTDQEITERIEELEDVYFGIWSSNASSRYITTNKIVNDTFDWLYSKYAEGHKLFDAFVDEYIERFGIRIHLIYLENMKDVMFDLVKNVEWFLSIFKDHEIRKAIEMMHLTLDFVTDENNFDFKLRNGVNAWNTGVYRYKGEIGLNLRALTNWDDAVVTLTHEVGHLFYYQIMNSSERDYWGKVYDELSGIKNDGPDYKEVLRKLNEFYDDLGSDFKLYKEQWKDYRNSVVNRIPDPKLVEDSFWKSHKNMDSYWYHVLSVIFVQRGLGMLDIFKTEAQQLEVKKQVTKLVEKKWGKEKTWYNESNTPIMSMGLVSAIDGQFYDVMSGTINNAKKESEVVKDKSGFPTDYASESAQEAFAEVFTWVSLRKTGIKGISRYKVSDWLLDQYRYCTKLKETFRKNLTIL